MFLQLKTFRAEVPETCLSSALRYHIAPTAVASRCIISLAIEILLGKLDYYWAQYKSDLLLILPLEQKVFVAITVYSGSIINPPSIYCGIQKRNILSAFKQGR